MSVTNTTIMSATTDWLVTTLTAGISDPVTSRTSKVPASRFVNTKYSGIPLLYPCITVQIVNVTASPSLGLQTESHEYTIVAEIEVYAKKRSYVADNLAESVLNVVRTYHYGSGGAIANNLFDPVVLSVVPVVEGIDMGVGGKEALHRRVITVQYKFVTDGL